MLAKAKQMQWIEGFRVGNNEDNSISVTHLLYADDTLTFCGTEKSQVQYLNLTLLLFEAISGLHINMQKSKIYQVNEVPNLEELAGIMGCSIDTFPTKYLGLPLGAKFKDAGVWNEVIEKMERRLATWKMQYLSMGGRLTLINSVLDSIPTYIMSMLPIPSKVQNQIDKIRRSFLWKGSYEGHKFHLVKWENVIMPKQHGGLGIRDLKKHNKSLLMKWWWRYAQEPTCIWKEVVNAKYGRQDKWNTKQNNDPYGVGPWKYINQLREEFFQEVSFRIGNGNSVKFWKDRWLNKQPLNVSHPAIYRIASDTDSSVAQNREGGIWGPHFRRNFQDWELNELFDFFRILEGASMTPHLPDSLKWGNSEKGIYTVKEGYHKLCSSNAMIDQWPWKLFWKTRLPSKIKCFTWTTLKNAILTLDNLNRRKLQLVNRCFMCLNSLESVNHLFLHCPVATALWNMFISIAGINWILLQSIKEVIGSWSLREVDSPIKKTWQMIPSCIFWCIWKERNLRCFDGISTPISSLKSFCVISLF